VLSAGHQLVATARRLPPLAGLAAQYPGQVLPVALDVADPAAAESAVRAAVEHFGRLDVVVNNAGYADVASIEDVTLDDFRAQIDTNFYGVVNVTKAAVPVLRAQGSGHIIQISSVGGRIASVGLAAYQSAKWAVEGFSSVLAQEVAPFGIKVTIIEPGGLRTDWAGSSMTIPPVSDPYQPTVGARVRMMEEHSGQQAGDPAKAARVIMQIAEIDDPPLRLLLGSDAVRYAGAADQARIESDAKWRALSESTDHDDATMAQKDPLAALRRGPLRSARTTPPRRPRRCPAHDGWYSLLPSPAPGDQLSELTRRAIGLGLDPAHWHVVVMAVADTPQSAGTGSQRRVAEAMAQASGRPRRSAFVVIGRQALGDPTVRETLQVFVEADLNVAATAKALSLHPNSLRYRLGRITELTGRDPAGRGSAGGQDHV